jgi:predicted nuclease with TOPRIM domain
MEMEKEGEVHGDAMKMEVEEVDGKVRAEVEEEDAEVEEVDAEVEEADGEVEVTQGEVQELEDEFHRMYTTIQDLFQKVDRATNVGAGDSRFSARASNIRNTNLAIERRTTLESSCDGCLFPAMCRNCGVRGDSSIFRCLACYGT